jgi:hypothetical protein
VLILIGSFLSRLKVVIIYHNCIRKNEKECSCEL